MFTLKEAYYKDLLTNTDLLLTPIYLIIFIVFFILLRNLLYPEDKLMRKYFMYGVLLKMLGAIAIGIVYFFYYNGGDTVEFYNNATVMYGAFGDNVTDFFILLFNGNEFNLPTSEEYMPWMFFRTDSSSYMVGKIAGVFSLITFNTYTPMALCFAAVSFSGIWALFVTFVEIYPKLKANFAIATLFVPSVFFWGSGILKDSITLACVGWITWASYNLFLRNKKKFSSIIMLCIATYFCLKIKPYIILSFAPSLVFWIFLNFRDKIQSRFLKTMVGPFVIIISTIAGYFVISKIGSEFQSYSLSNAMNTASNFQNWHGYLAKNSNASGYSLGTMDGSTLSIIKNIPAAINVTLFRPYIWETRNPVMLLSALESFALMIFTIRIFYRTGIGRTFKAIGSNATVFFCIFFSLFFGFCVGFTAYNFGALVRYKIPCIPFFVAGLFILNYITEEENAKRIAAKTRF